MAMLSEPRRRKRYNLVPRGKALYEDDSRFGTKMLEKMGWKKGQGLGAKEDGSKDFVRVRYKNDALGLGFEDRDDQWTQHEQHFNGLLSTLTTEDGGDQSMEKDMPSEDEIQPRVGFGFQESNVDKAKSNSGKMKEKISGISLEERSKQSKARVHYKKFTKGKDLAQYSEKDLANIFGKKAVDEENDVNKFFHQLNSSGVQMINSGLSIDDYFKRKMEPCENPQNEFDTSDNLTSNEIDLVENTKKSKKDKGDDIEGCNEKDQECKSQMVYSNISINDYFKKKMNDLKNKKNGLNTQEDIAQGAEEEIKTVEPVKKKKKSKKDLNDKEIGDEQDPVKKKSKKNKKISERENVENNIDNEEQKTKNGYEDKFVYHSLDEECETLAIKNKKKSKKCIEDSTKSIDTSKKIKDKSKSINKIQTEVTEETVTKKRKYDKSQMETELSGSVMEPLCKTDLTQQPTKKKKKKDITRDTTEVIDLDNNDIDTVQNAESQTITDKKKKKNNLDKGKEIPEKTKNSDNLMEPHYKIDLTQEPAKKKKKKDKTQDTTEVTDLDNNDIDTVQNAESQTIKDQEKEKHSFHKGKETTETTNNKGNLMEPHYKIDLTQEPAKKKKKKDITRDTTEVTDLHNNDIDTVQNAESQTIKDQEKEKHSFHMEKETIETTSNNDNLTSSNTKESKPARSKKKNVSSTSKNVFVTDVDFQLIDLDEIRKQFHSFNIYPISTFCAEKFRNVNANGFKDSSLLQLEGYGLGPDLQLDVHPNKFDEERITNLWKGVLNKYCDLGKPKEPYRNYVKEFYRARKKKQKLPKLNVKTFKRKNIFKLL